MIDLKKIIRIDDSNFSDNISKIDVLKDFVVCTHTNNTKVLLNDLNIITLKTNKNLSCVDYPSAGSGFEFASKCKFSIPKHIQLEFVAPLNNFYYKHIYTHCDHIIGDTNIIYDNCRHVIIIEKDIMRMFNQMLTIKKDEEILYINPKYTLNTIHTLENFYLIEDDYIYEEFINHFLN